MNRLTPPASEEIDKNRVKYNSFYRAVQYIFLPEVLFGKYLYSNKKGRTRKKSGAALKECILGSILKRKIVLPLFGD